MREIKSTPDGSFDAETLTADDKTLPESVLESSSKNFDDSCFKAPLPPQKKFTTLPSKKKSAGGNGTNGRLNGHMKSTADGAEGEAKLILAASLQRLNIDGVDDDVAAVDDRSRPAPSSEVCVSIGKDSYLCPYARQYFAVEFPDLVLEKKTGGEDVPATEEAGEMLLEEVIIDGFSLLLFTSAEDYDVIKEFEKVQKERARAEDKRRSHDASLRSGKLKKCRKNKAEKADWAVRKEERDLKERERQERREERRQRKEQKERLARDKQERRDRLQLLSAEERLAEKRREKRERREAAAAALVNGTTNGPSTSAMADAVAAFGGSDMTADVVVELNGIVLPPSITPQPRAERSKEELRRLKRDKKLQQMKQQLKHETSGPSDENLRHTVNHRDGIAIGLSGIATVSPAGALGNAQQCSSDIVRKMATTLTAAGTNDERSADAGASSSLNLLLNGCAANASSTDAEALKRLASSSAIGIAPRNRVILSPMDNVLESGASTKLQKVGTGINDFFLNAHQQLTGIGGGGAKLLPHSNLSALKTEIKMENGHVSKSALPLNNSTDHSQRFTPLSKADYVNSGNSASSSTGLQPSAMLQTPSTSISSGGGSGLSTAAAALTLSQPSKQLPMPGGVDASTLAVIQQLFGGPTPAGGALPVAPVDDVTRAAAFLQQQQSLLLSHPELLHVGQPKGLPPKANLFDANLMAAAHNSGYTLLNHHQQQIFQQQQLEQFQKRPINNASSRPFATDATSKLPKLGADSTSLLPPGFSANILAGADSVMASVAANTANLAKINKPTDRWANRHVTLATKIARESDHQRNLAVATQLQQQLLSATSQQQHQQLLQQQKLLQQHQQQFSMAFLPGNSKQPAIVDAAVTAPTTSVTSNNYNNGRKRSDNSTDNSSGLPYKKQNLGQTVAPTLMKQQQDQQRHQQQQAMQIAAAKKQQQLVAQQQQLQLEAQRRQQQQQQNATADLFAQLQQQHLQQLKQLQQQQKLHSVPSKSTATAVSTRPPTAAVKSAATGQHPQSNGLPPPASAAAQQLLLPPSFMNSAALFHPGTPKLNHNGLLGNVSDYQQQRAQPQQNRAQPQQNRALLQQQQQPPSQPLGYVTPSATPQQNMLLSLSMADPLSQNLGQQLHSSQAIMGAMGFPVANVAPSAVAGGSLTSGTSAQAAALAAATPTLDPSTALLNNIMSLQQQSTGAGAQSSVLTQMAVAQMMMQQMGAQLPTSVAAGGAENPLNSLQSRQQQMAANNIFASLGMLSNPTTPAAAATPLSQYSQAHFVQLPPLPPSQQQQSAQQRLANPPSAAQFTGISTTSTVPAAPETTSTVSAPTASANSVSLQQQQQDLLQQPCCKASNRLADDEVTVSS